MRSFQQRPPQIQAEQVTGERENALEILQWVIQSGGSASIVWSSNGLSALGLNLKTGSNAEDWVFVPVGDWVIFQYTVFVRLPDKEFQEHYEPSKESSGVAL